MGIMRVHDIVPLAVWEVLIRKMINMNRKLSEKDKKSKGNRTDFSFE